MVFFDIIISFIILLSNDIFSMFLCSVARAYGIAISLQVLIYNIQSKTTMFTESVRMAPNKYPLRGYLLGCYTSLKNTM